jgi:hypothetical protein
VSDVSEPVGIFDPKSDWQAAWRTASESADRFRDVICQALDLDENPGDDDLVFQLLKAHGKADEPESHRWRGFLGQQLDRMRPPAPNGEPDHDCATCTDCAEEYRLRVGCHDGVCCQKKAQR